LSKIKIGLYLNNKCVANVDLSEPEKGNPGVGGTQFNFVTLPYYFIKYFPDKVDFIWYADSIRHLPHQVRSRQVTDVFDAITQADDQGCDIFIWRPTDDDIGRRVVERLDSFKVKSIAWAHNTPGVHGLNRLADSVQLKRLVCVGQEQLDRLRDHRIFDKATCIVNGFDPQAYIPNGQIEKKGNQVVYLGSLIKSKGFHHLARAWFSIKEQSPDAKLVVIGSGRLYNRDQVLGQWGVADENYERTYIRPYLSDEQGHIHESVDFRGTLGTEKIEILQRADVGVVNPSGATENCPGSAIEFQAAGTPVVSGAYRGLLDTVVHKRTGLLGRGDRDLVDNVVHLLRNSEVARAYGQSGIRFVKDKFSYERVSRQWLALFDAVCDDRPNLVEGIHQYPFNDYKILREMMRLLRRYMPFLQDMPSLAETKALLRRIQND
jgi:glycosyltransferase involved in cell wall biosynthesis